MLCFKNNFANNSLLRITSHYRRQQKLDKNINLSWLIFKQAVHVLQTTRLDLLLHGWYFTYNLRCPHAEYCNLHGHAQVCTKLHLLFSFFHHRRVSAETSPRQNRSLHRINLLPLQARGLWQKAPYHFVCLKYNARYAETTARSIRCPWAKRFRAFYTDTAKFASGTRVPYTLRRFSLAPFVLLLFLLFLPLPLLRIAESANWIGNSYEGIFARALPRFAAVGIRGAVGTEISRTVLKVILRTPLD